MTASPVVSLALFNSLSISLWWEMLTIGNQYDWTQKSIEEIFTMLIYRLCSIVGVRHESPPPDSTMGICWNPA